MEINIYKYTHLEPLLAMEQMKKDYKLNNALAEYHYWSKMKQANLINKNRRWTEIEDIFLEDNWGRRTKKGMAKALNRTERAIGERGKKLGLGRQYHSVVGFTTVDVAKMFHMDRLTVKKLGLNFQTPKCYHNCDTDIKVVTATDFYKYLNKHREELPLHLLKIDTLPDCPEWLKKYKSKKVTKLRIYREWTYSEEQQLLRYANNGLARKEIARLMNRSLESIRVKLCRLNKAV